MQCNLLNKEGRIEEKGGSLDPRAARWTDDITREQQVQVAWDY
jgi:hypothetical protein